eukprot:CAMPEP_0197068992 /NCGR_PEP_ID=MMETSP1384-20130603/190277_1 /TAXON_ID=29189 /ORGANISM="Ammonia sp." /LENGTH=85 /DNA_ID=CAMNT_0042506905 /DNA_START=69 /DNA_END=322 /DNA_ORIENTATION=-
MDLKINVDVDDNDDGTLMRRILQKANSMETIHSAWKQSFVHQAITPISPALSAITANHAANMHGHSAATCTPHSVARTNSVANFT